MAEARTVKFLYTGGLYQVLPGGGLVVGLQTVL